jgi:hypothetical protein
MDRKLQTKWDMVHICRSIDGQNGLDPNRTSPHTAAWWRRTSRNESPWQIGKAERLIGSIRPNSLDQGRNR